MNPNDYNKDHLVWQMIIEPLNGIPNSCRLSTQIVGRCIPSSTVPLPSKNDFQKKRREKKYTCLYPTTPDYRNWRLLQEIQTADGM